MTAPTKRNARRAPGAPYTTDDDTTKPNGGRPPHQGNSATGRNPSQPAPTWPAPRGIAAARDLAHALRGWSAMHGYGPQLARRRGRR
jgi:hypothetical protein